MISLIVPLFLVLMILLIFYIYDLHLSIKTGSNSVDNNVSTEDSQTSSWTDNLLGELSYETDSSGVSDVSAVTWDSDAMLDLSGTSEEIASYDRDDVIAMLNSIAVNTNVGVTITDTDQQTPRQDPSAPRPILRTPISQHVCQFEYVISTYL